MAMQQLTLDLFDAEDRKPRPGEVDYYPLPSPCQLSSGCCSHHLYEQTGNQGCSGNVAMCEASQLAAGRTMRQSQWDLLHPYTRRRYEEIIRNKRR